MNTLATPLDGQPTLFERVAACPEHEPERADILRDDRGDFRAWLLGLPRVPR